MSERESSSTLAPAIQVSRRAAGRLRGGHLWIYRSDVEATVPREHERGALVTVLDARGKALGTALWSTSSQIAARLVSRRPLIDRAEYLEQFRERLRRAIQLRVELAPVDEWNDAHRLVFSEADGLPGVTADRYNELIVLQLLTQGTAQADIREAIREIFAAEFAHESGGITVWERPDPRMQKLELLNEPPAGPLFTNAVEGARAQTTIHLNGLAFRYDAGAGQKTGAFLDQRLNYPAAANWAQRLLRANGKPGRALDVCTYHGGFALHLAGACERVTGVDASRTALEAADKNLRLNPKLRAAVDWIEADAFELLRALEEGLGRGAAKSAGNRRGATLPPSLGGRFDAIVLDPPAFAKTRRAAEGALRGYKELNLRALRLLEHGGLLVTCSCSHHVSAEEFREAVRAAAVDAGRAVQVLEERGAAPDHPELLALPETRYLKCVICRVE